MCVCVREEGRRGVRWEPFLGRRATFFRAKVGFSGNPFEIDVGMAQQMLGRYGHAKWSAGQKQEEDENHSVSLGKTVIVNRVSIFACLDIHEKSFKHAVLGETNTTCKKNCVATRRYHKTASRFVRARTHEARIRERPSNELSEQHDVLNDLRHGDINKLLRDTFVNAPKTAQRRAPLSLSPHRLQRRRHGSLFTVMLKTTMNTLACWRQGLNPPCSLGKDACALGEVVMMMSRYERCRDRFRDLAVIHIFD